MSGVNKAIVIGRLGQDPELKYTPNGGNAVCNFSLATSEKFKTRSGGEKEETQWHRIVCWGKTAEIAAEHLSKGGRFILRARLNTDRMKIRTE
jgi:single-strand DNA-binding protein